MPTRNRTNNDFDSFIPIASKATKAAKAKGQEGAIFKLFSLGVVTSRVSVWPLIEFLILTS
jgi:predicted helicase